MSSGARLLAANVIRLRTARGLNEAALARLLGVEPQAIVAIETAASPEITLDQIDALTKALGVAPLELFQPAQ